MSVTITINNCGECPHKSHKGAFGVPAYKPCCGKTGNVLKFRIEKGHRNVPTAVFDKTSPVPQSCPFRVDPDSTRNSKLGNRTFKQRMLMHFYEPSTCEEVAKRMGVPKEKVARSIQDQRFCKLGKHLGNGVYQVSEEEHMRVAPNYIKLYNLLKNDAGERWTSLEIQDKFDWCQAQFSGAMQYIKNNLDIEIEETRMSRNVRSYRVLEVSPL